MNFIGKFAITYPNIIMYPLTHTYHFQTSILHKKYNYTHTSTHIIAIVYVQRYSLQHCLQEQNIRDIVKYLSVNVLISYDNFITQKHYTAVKRYEVDQSTRTRKYVQDILLIENKVTEWYKLRTLCANMYSHNPG